METLEKQRNILAGCLAVCLLLLLLACAALFLPAPALRYSIQETPRASSASRPGAREILSSTRVIAHGTGKLGDVTILNCLESFLESYAKGVRVFEVDLRLTADGAVVLRHDWRSGWQEGISEKAIPTLEEFLSKPVLGQYTPLSWQDLLHLMETYPDVCVITDTKFTDSDAAAAQFGRMVADAEELGLSHLFDRIVIQYYNRNMHAALAHAYHFSHYIYTLYNERFHGTAEEFREIAAYCASQGTENITMWADLWDPAFLPIARSYNLRVYVHTVNDPAAAMALLKSGVSGVYTDVLTDALVHFRPMDKAMFRLFRPKGALPSPVLT